MSKSLKKSEKNCLQQNSKPKTIYLESRLFNVLLKESKLYTSLV